MSFDAYEFVGVVVPGALPTIAATILFPEVGKLIGAGGVELGGLGLFLIISFVAGHVVQAISNMIERMEDRFGWGLHDMPFAKGRSGVSEAQWQRFLAACERRLNVRTDDISKSTWAGIRKEVVAFLPDETSRRIEVFNRTYGLCRGIAAGFLLTAFVVLAIEGATAWEVTAALFLAAVLMHLRKRRFGRLYLQEVVARFLASDASRDFVAT